MGRRRWLAFRRLAGGNAGEGAYVRGGFVDVRGVVGLVVASLGRLDGLGLLVDGLLALDDRGTLVAAGGELWGS